VILDLLILCTRTGGVDGPGVVTHVGLGPLRLSLAILSGWERYKKVCEEWWGSINSYEAR
jgi:hypothetical protein